MPDVTIDRGTSRVEPDKFEEEIVEIDDTRIVSLLPEQRG
jgi:hypothetical protein